MRNKTREAIRGLTASKHANTAGTGKRNNARKEAGAEDRIGQDGGNEKRKRKSQRRRKNPTRSNTGRAPRNAKTSTGKDQRSGGTGKTVPGTRKNWDTIPERNPSTATLPVPTDTPPTRSQNPSPESEEDGQKERRRKRSTGTNTRRR